MTIVIVVILVVVFLVSEHRVIPLSQSFRMGDYCCPHFTVEAAEAKRD